MRIVVLLGYVVSNMLLSRWRVGQGERLFHLSVDLVWCGGRLPCLPPSFPHSGRRDCPLRLLGRNYFIVENNRCSDRTEEKVEGDGLSVRP